jgi:transcriptional regulator
VSHIPFILAEDGQSAELHLVRSNPIVQALKTPQNAMIAVQGPDSYISPDWYEVPDQVPTWNYVAVHIRGTLELMPQDGLHAMLDRLSAHFEPRLAPKKPWLTSKMTDGVMQRMMRMIVPCRMTVASIDGTWKLSQNKDDAVRLRAAAKAKTDGIGHDLEQLAQWMRDLP